MTTRPAEPRPIKRHVHLELVGSAEPGPALHRHPQDGFTLAHPYPLGPGARRTLTALILALCPPAPAPHSAELLARVDLGARRLLRYMHPVVARGLSFGLSFLDWLPVLSFASAFRLHRLDGARARALVARWARSPFRLLRLFIVGVRGMVLSVYFDQSEVHAAMRYAPVEHLQSRLALRARLLQPAALAAE